MQRVWLDNTLMTGLEEMRVILEQIIQSAEGSKEVLGRFSGISGKRETLHKEWDNKESVLQSFVESFTTVLHTIPRRTQRIGTSVKLKLKLARREGGKTCFNFIGRACRC